MLVTKQRKTCFHGIFKQRLLIWKKRNQEGKIDKRGTAKAWTTSFIINFSSFGGHILVRIECLSLLYSMYAQSKNLSNIQFAQLVLCSIFSATSTLPFKKQECTPVGCISPASVTVSFRGGVYPVGMSATLSGQTDGCENITLPQTSFSGGKNVIETTKHLFV